MKWLKRLMGVKAVKIPEAVPASRIRLVKSDDHERVTVFGWDDEQWAIEYATKADKFMGDALLAAECSNTLH